MRRFLTRRGLSIPAPLRRATFRQLWLSMSMSYAGDRLQQLAQAWLVATLSGSALAVGAIAALGSIPLLLMPVGGVIADQVNRRRLLLAGQLMGATSTAIIALLALTDQVAIWHIYIWAFVNGVVVLISRPSYKVVLTESVPADEVRSAVAINSMTETVAMMLVNAGGSILLGLLGLTLAFVLNAATYLVAAASLWGLRDLGRLPDGHTGTLSARQVLVDLREGITYLRQQPGLLHPLLLTFAIVIATSPAIGLLAAIVHSQDGSIIELGMFAAATSVGAFVGAGFAGVRSAGDNPIRTYARIAGVAAIAIALFAVLPLGVASLLPLAVMGFIMFSQAVWNTSRIRQVAGAAYQARLQSITSMAFTLGFSVGMLWAGVAIDQFGLIALLGGALVLGALSITVGLLNSRSPAAIPPEPDSLR